MRPVPSSRAPACRLALACALVLALPGAALAQDEVVTYDDVHVLGRVVQATEGLVVVVVPPVDGEPQEPVSLPSLQVAELHWHASSGDREPAQFQLETWFEPFRADPADPNNPPPRPLEAAQLIPGLRALAATSPVALDVFDGLVLADDATLVTPQAVGPQAVTPEAVGPPARGRSIRLPLAEALAAVGWWRTEPMLLTLLSAEMDKPRAEWDNPLLYRVSEVMKGHISHRSLDLLTRLLEFDHAIANMIPGYLQELSADGYSAEVFQAVRPYLTHSSPDVRYRAWWSLEGGNVETSALLLETALSDESPDVRRVVVRMLGTSPEPAHADRLLARLFEETDLEVIRHATLSLGEARLKNYFVVPGLIDRAEAASSASPFDVAVRRYIVVNALNKIAAHVGYGENWELWRKWWTDVGAGLAEREANRLTPGELQALLGSNDPAERLKAIRGLARNPNFLGNSELVTILSEDKDQKTSQLVRIAAADVIGERAAMIMRRNPEIFEELIDLLEDELVPDVKKRIITALTKLSGRDNINLGSDVGMWRQYLLLRTAADQDAVIRLVRDFLRSGDETFMPQRIALRTIEKRQLRPLAEDIVDFLTSPASAKGGLKRDGMRSLVSLTTKQDIDILYVLCDFVESPDRSLSNMSLIALRRLTGVPGLKPKDNDCREAVDALASQ